MKKIIVAVLCLVMTFAFFGCKKSDSDPTAPKVNIEDSSKATDSDEDIAKDTTLPEGVGYEDGYFDNSGEFWLTDGSGYYKDGKFNPVDENGEETEEPEPTQETTEESAKGIYAGKYKGENGEKGKATMALTYADGKYKAKIIFKGFTEKGVNGTYNISFKESSLDDIGEEIYRISAKDKSGQKISIFFSATETGYVAQILVDNSANCATYK